MPVKLQLAAVAWSTSSLCGGRFSSVICADVSTVVLVTLTYALYVSVTVLTLCTFGTTFSSFVFKTVLLPCNTLNACATNEEERRRKRKKICWKKNRYDWFKYFYAISIFFQLFFSQFHRFLRLNLFEN